ncbi:Uncharacterised protein [[Clostridium] sordellii]|uniref:hypothetical protein n=1 Tax=Paraclostridium sordellii TaxID=1505 RepID=UPI0005DF369A|nr:hypothetical protein [Paeniclostridium sordellii]CEQ26511.1 Uncharacterised protein [[Clostridium] sordellii] [Paeniclostridium sordellii]
MFRLFNEKNEKVNDKYKKPEREWQDDLYKSLNKLRTDIKKLGLKDAVDQFYCDNQPSHIKLECLAILIQETASSRLANDITLTREQVEHLYRGILDMLKHLPNELPDGAYSYMNCNMTCTFIDILKQLSNIK